MKKRWKVLIIVLVAFFGSVGGAVLVMSWISPDFIPVMMSAINNYKWTYISDEDFNRYYDDFVFAADFAANHDNSKHYLYFSHSKLGKIYDSVTNTSLNISDEERTRFQNIDYAFDNSGGELDKIKITKSFISIQINNHCFAVVYSRDGSKPTAVIGFEDRGYSFYTRKVRDNWYFVTGT